MAQHTPLKPRVIGICGKAGVGKDTLAQWLSQRHGYVIRPLAAPMKAALNARFGWTMADWDDREWKETPCSAYGVRTDRHDTRTRVLGAGDMFSPRSWAQWLGTEVGRELGGKDFWLDVWRRQWTAEGQPPVIIPDVRFDNEAVFVHDLGGPVVQILRPGVRAVSAHASEAGISGGLVNHTLVNMTTPEDLYRRAVWVLDT